MVQFPTSGFVHLCVQCTLIRFYPNRVTPFGNRRITGCVLLPVAFRSLPRPSSPDSPKASTMNPYSLDHIYRYTLIYDHDSRIVNYLTLDFCAYHHIGLAYVKGNTTFTSLYPSLCMSKNMPLANLRFMIHVLQCMCHLICRTDDCDASGG